MDNKDLILEVGDEIFIRGKSMFTGKKGTFVRYDTARRVDRRVIIVKIGENKKSFFVDEDKTVIIVKIGGEEKFFFAKEIIFDCRPGQSKNA